MPKVRRNIYTLPFKLHILPPVPLFPLILLKYIHKFIVGVNITFLYLILNMGKWILLSIANYNTAKTWNETFTKC